MHSDSEPTKLGTFVLAARDRNHCPLFSTTTPLYCSQWAIGYCFHYTSDSEIAIDANRRNEEEIDREQVPSAENSSTIFLCRLHALVSRIIEGALAIVPKCVEDGSRVE